MYPFISNCQSKNTKTSIYVSNYIQLLICAFTHLFHWVLAQAGCAIRAPFPAALCSLPLNAEQFYAMASPALFFLFLFSASTGIVPQIAFPAVQGFAPGMDRQGRSLSHKKTPCPRLVAVCQPPILQQALLLSR